MSPGAGAAWQGMPLATLSNNQAMGRLIIVYSNPRQGLTKQLQICQEGRSTDVVLTGIYLLCPSKDGQRITVRRVEMARNVVSTR
jgi:hypothetical protein